MGSEVIRVVTEHAVSVLGRVWDVRVYYGDPGSCIEWSEPVGRDLKVKSLLFSIVFEGSEAWLSMFDFLIGPYPFADPGFPQNLLRRVMGRSVVEVIVCELALIPGVRWEVALPQTREERPGFVLYRLGCGGFSDVGALSSVGDGVVNLILYGRGWEERGIDVIESFRYDLAEPGSIDRLIGRFREHVGV
jgi:hypothetical protein